MPQNQPHLLICSTETCKVKCLSRLITSRHAALIEGLLSREVLENSWEHSCVVHWLQVCWPALWRSWQLIRPSSDRVLHRGWTGELIAVESCCRCGAFTTAKSLLKPTFYFRRSAYELFPFFIYHYHTQFETLLRGQRRKLKRTTVDFQSCEWF